jgi:Terminase small subunit
MMEKKTAVSVGLGTYAGEPAAAAPEQCLPERDTAPKTPLTHKQQLFVEYYLKFLNSVEAAVAAGYTPEMLRPTLSG